MDNYRNNYEYEEEIDLKMIFFYCIAHWRSMMIAALIGAVLVGGFYVIDNRNQQKSVTTGPTLSEEQLLSNEMNEKYADLYEMQVDSLAEAIDSSNILNLNPYDLYVGTTDYFVDASDENWGLITYEIDTTLLSQELYKTVENSIDRYTVEDLSQMMSVEYVSVYGKRGMRVKVYGETEEDASDINDAVLALFNQKIEDLSDSLGVEFEQKDSYFVNTTKLSIKDYQKSLYNNYSEAEKEYQAVLGKVILESDTQLSSGSSIKKVAIFSLVGMFVGAMLAAMVHGCVFLLDGSLVSVYDVERRYGVKLLGKVAAKKHRCKLDRWIYTNIYGLYSQFDKERQEKIVLTNVLNELKKQEKVHHVLLLSTVVDVVNESCSFIIEGLKKAGYVVNSVDNVIGSPDLLYEGQNDTAVLILENINESKKALLKEEIDVINSYNETLLGVVLLNRA